MRFTHSILNRYGKIIADKEHKTTEGLFIRFTTYAYEDKYYVVVLCNGSVIAIAEENDVHDLMK